MDRLTPTIHRHVDADDRHITHTARDWLNDPGQHTIGLVLFNADWYSYGAKPKTLDSLELTIGDCSRQITLELSHSTAEEKLNSIKKLNTLIAYAELALTYLTTEVTP